MPGSVSCMIVNMHDLTLNALMSFITDIILLALMLVGLLRLGFHEPGVFGLGRLMWKQVRVCACRLSRYFLNAYTLPLCKGLIWLFIATIVYVPAMVSGANLRNSMYPSLQLIVTLPSQVLISLNLNGRLLFLSCLLIVNADRT
jgi:hypothetical protein